jgi:ankyrin repeat protein
MIKVNGVRVEIGELEAALQDEATEHPVVVDSLCKVKRHAEAAGVSASLSDLVCFVLLSNVCLAQMGVMRELPDSGVLVPPSLPLFVLLRERCRLKARVAPSTFIVIPRIPLTPTGKRDRKWTRTVEESAAFSSLMASDATDQPVPLREYSQTGALLAKILVEHLNLLPVQEALLTSSAKYATTGGDSLSATRVVRALYAHHCGVQDSRFLGGAYGQLEEPFTVRAIVTAGSLATYADFLDESGFRNGPSVIDPSDNREANRAVDEDRRSAEDNDASLYEALLQAVTLGHNHVAAALMDVGADPNYGAHGGRLGKVSGRKNRMASFRTSPLHIACLRGNSGLVQKLLECKARYNSPDPSGMFPIHLLAAGKSQSVLQDDLATDDVERLACMKQLLRAGAPILMKDGSKQTVLHCAARSGYCELLRFLMSEFQTLVKEDPRKADCFNWRDNWSRTPVHWAVLNGNAEALEVLLRMGCSAHPPKPKVIARSSVANESPSEICERLHGSSELGRRIMGLLEDHR